MLKSLEVTSTVDTVLACIQSHSFCSVNQHKVQHKQACAARETAVCSQGNTCTSTVGKRTCAARGGWDGLHTDIYLNCIAVLKLRSIVLIIHSQFINLSTMGFFNTVKFVLSVSDSYCMNTRKNRCYCG